MYNFKERGVDLEVEGVHYIEMYNFKERGGDLELEG